ncbi:MULTISPECIES: hypothetical protein [unclassified Streptomyces]|uniref:hypothetical protein n=1 Tax=unclassified Streptomyces TaxID=2593676 RepID=UPI000315A702|nr:MULTISPECIES: hypothetical protein [unclassified Streptomyces]MYR39512.1 hypothetical protein [Streptomyces sp. SID4944]SCD84909.1 hypothetical protein GA0115244_112532 [Streptomyces sp. DvalAA-19]
MRAELFTPGGGGPVPDGWDAFVRDRRACVLWEAGLLEAAAWGSLRPVFAGLVREAGEPVAAFCGRLGVRPVSLRFRPPGRAAVPGWFQVHVPNSFSPGRLYAPGLDTAGRRAATRAFEREVRRRLGPRCLGILHLDADTSELAHLGGPLRLRRATAPNAVLHNRWESMDAYFAGLPRGRRRRLSALHGRVGADPELVVESAVPVIDPVHASRLDQLTRMKHTDRPSRVVPLLPAYFDRLNRSPGASYFAHRDKSSGRPVSFDLVLDAPGGWLTTVTGSDGGRDLYLDLYLREIDRLIATGVPAVELGPGMQQLKESFGATAVPRHAVAVPF